MAVDGDGRKWLPREKVMSGTPGGNNRRISDQSRRDPPGGASLRGAQTAESRSLRTAGSAHRTTGAHVNKYVT